MPYKYFNHLGVFMGKSARLEARIDEELKKKLLEYCSENEIQISKYLSMVITRDCGGIPVDTKNDTREEFKDLWVRLRMDTYLALQEAAASDGITAQNLIRRLIKTSLMSSVQINKESSTALRESNREMAFIGRGLHDLVKMLKTKQVSEKDSESIAKLTVIISEIDKHKKVVTQLLNENWNRYDINR